MKFTLLTKVLIGVAVLGAAYFIKVKWIDTMQRSVGESQTFGEVSIPTAPEASLSGADAIKLPFPSTEVSHDGKTKIRWEVMAWQSQNSMIGANGGRITTEGSLFNKSGLDVEFVRKDNCTESATDLLNFCLAYQKAYQDGGNGSNIPAVFVTYMGSGVPALLTSVDNQLKEKLGKDYDPLFAPKGFLTTGKSYGEDQLMGPLKYKTDKNNLKGATVVAVRMDGDADLALKLAGDFGIKVNSDEHTYDPDALNFTYAESYIDAGTKYIGYYTSTKKLVKNGKTQRDTTVGVDLVATWTPVDVTIANSPRAHKEGIATIVSTKEWSSIMSNQTLTCGKWHDDHLNAVKEVIKDCGIMGDQIRTFDETKRWACGLNVDVYKEKNCDADYWYKYFNGVQVNEDLHLGGSAVFNTVDMANMMGISVKGKTDNNDIYGSVYTTFGDLQSKYYPKDLPHYVGYDTAFDKTALSAIVNSNTNKGLLNGTPEVADYSKAMTNRVGKRAFNIIFATGSDNILPVSFKMLRDIYNAANTADGTKIVVTGYTDNVGEPNNNQILSEKRANAVSAKLQELGLVSERIQAVGRGENNPVGDNNTANGKAANRRVEIELYAK